MKTFTHEELWQAVRETAEGREFFSSADVRKHLGVGTRDKAKLNAFHTAFRGFLKAAAGELESAGKNRYRIAGQAHVAVASVAAVMMSEVSHADQEAVVEPAVIEAPRQVAVVMADAADHVAMAEVIDAPASHELVAPAIGKVRVLPAFAARVVHDVTQRPVVQRWRDRAQRVSRRVVQLFHGLGIRTRTAA
jgi:hypothetical protein